MLLSKQVKVWNNHIMKKHIAFSALFLMSLSGCAKFQPTSLPPIEVNNRQLLVEDNRPREEIKTEMLSYLVTSCNYGIQRLGDEWSEPNKIDYLANKIKNQIPEAKKLTIEHFVTYLNMQYSLREGNVFRNGDIWQHFECDERTDRFVSYTQEENPQRLNIVIGTLEGSIDGKHFSERVSEFPTCPNSAEKCTGWDSWGEAVKNIVLKLTDKVTSQEINH